MIVLYNPQSSPGKKPVMPLSILALAAHLEGRYDYTIIDGNLVDDGAVAVLDAIKSDQVNLLAVTVMPGPQLTDAVPVSRAAKSAKSDLQIVWGGYFPTMHGDVAITEDFVDYCLKGHSELAFLELVEAVMAGREPSRSLSGLLKCSGDKVLDHPIGPVPDVTKMPPFPYHRLEMERYVRPTFMGTRTLSHHSSYGCPFTCNFCAVVNMVGGRYSAETPAQTLAAVEKLVKTYGANAIEFFDNNFFVQESRVAEVCEQLASFDIRWWAYGRIDTMLGFSDKTWKMMRESGLAMVYLGAEAGSDETLERMNKGGKMSADATLEISAKMREHGIVPEFSFILGNPPDAKADIENSFRFIRTVKSINPHAEIVLYTYTPVPLAGSLLTDAKSAGFEFPSTLDEWILAEWQDFAHHRTSDLPWLSQRLRQKVIDFGLVLNARFPTMTDPGLSATGKTLARIVGSWRYRTGIYSNPYELQILRRLFPFQRPEVVGF